MFRFLQRWRPHSRRAWLILAALLVLACAAVAAYRIAPPYYHLHAAEQALRKYDLDGAQQHLDACLQSWPDSPDILLLATRTARRRGAYADAESRLAMCRRFREVGPAIALEHALLQAQQGDLAEVEAPLQARVEQKDPDAPFVLEALARGYFLNHRLPQSLQCLDLLLDLRPDDLPALLLRGQVLESAPDDDEAARDYDRAVSLQPFSTEARLRLANTLTRLGRTREAVGQYECLRQRPPVPPDAFVGLARCRCDLHELDEARRLLDELLAAHPDHVPGLVERGRLALRDGQPEDGEGFLRRAAALDPFDRDAQLVLSHCLTEEGKHDEAEQVRARLGRIEADRHRVANLIAKADDAPHDADLRCEIGRLLLGLGQDQQGLRWLSMALREDPGHAPTHAALADYFERAGRPEEAALHRGPAQQTN